MTEEFAKDVMVGLEIHQQLATGKKLFCDCAPIESDQYPIRFQRRLRASRGELGELDAAAVLENARSKTILYLANPQSSCLVEQDEEPPHAPDTDAKEIALIIAATLNSKVFGEIFTMRKTVVDGSNTSGFQRTMLIAQGGCLEVSGTKIGIQSICLEEDAAKILGDEDSTKRYGLERLGVPLIEIATEPFEAKSGRVKDVALALGRILRSTKRVKRGLGSIRQDVNVSINKTGIVIEVKGVQQLDQLEKVVQYEAKRQHGLVSISEKMQNRGWSHQDADRLDITGIMTGCSSKIVQEAIRGGQSVSCVIFRNMSGIFGFSPYEGIRLGKEIAELVRFFGIGGVFHSDELPAYGIKESDIKKIRQFSKITDDDAFLILATSKDIMCTVIDQIISRVSRIRDHCIPVDTRMATPTGETRFLRPRPGAARMYPETDVLPVTVSQEDLYDAQSGIPVQWEEAIGNVCSVYGLSTQLAEQIFDSQYMEVFEAICSTTDNPPAFVASILCSSITSLERKGLDRAMLSDKTIGWIFELLDQKRISKESIEMILESIMSGKNPEQVIEEVQADSLSDEELDTILDGIINDNTDIIKRQRERALAPLMGVAMRTLRGKTSGQKINKILQQKIRKVLQ